MYKIIKIEPLDKLIIKATFKGGEIKLYDINRILDKWEDFRLLKDNPMLYKNVKIDCGGYGIAWNDYIDLASEEIWDNGTSFEKVEPYKDELS